MREVLRVLGFMLAFVAAILIAAALCWKAMGAEDPAAGHKETESKGEFLRGLNMGRSFLPPRSEKGKKVRRKIYKINGTWGAWCREYCPHDYTPCLFRVSFESWGDPWSKSRDNKELEAGLTSVSWDTARTLDELGMGGDPCGDPEWSIAASCWERRNRRRNMLEGDCPGNDAACWSNWLLELYEFNRIEAEYFMGIAGSVNSAKVKYLIKKSKALREEHVWWEWIRWLRSQSDAQLMGYLEPLEVELWRFGFRIGRSSFNTWRFRASFFKPIEGDNGDEPQPNYCWGDVPYWFPQREEKVWQEWDAMPEALYPMPTFGKWRDRCIYYDKREVRRRRWHEPALKDRYKKTACRHGTCWKKGELKYPTHEDWASAHAAWVDEMQAQRLLPSDEEYAGWELEMETACPIQAVDVEN